MFKNYGAGQRTGGLNSTSSNQKVGGGFAI